MMTIFLSPRVRKSASSHESQLVDAFSRHTFLDTLRSRLIGDKACDSDRWIAIWSTASKDQGVDGPRKHRTLVVIP